MYIHTSCVHNTATLKFFLLFFVIFSECFRQFCKRRIYTIAKMNGLRLKEPSLWCLYTSGTECCAH